MPQLKNVSEERQVYKAKIKQNLGWGSAPSRKESSEHIQGYEFESSCYSSDKAMGSQKGG